MRRAWPSGGFVFANLLLDLVRVSPRISPGVREVLGTERGIGAKQVGHARSQVPSLHEKPDGDARRTMHGSPPHTSGWLSIRERPRPESWTTH